MPPSAIKLPPVGDGIPILQISISRNNRKERQVLMIMVTLVDNGGVPDTLRFHSSHDTQGKLQAGDSHEWMFLTDAVQSAEDAAREIFFKIASFFSKQLNTKINAKNASERYEIDGYTFLQYDTKAHGFHTELAKVLDACTAMQPARFQGVTANILCVAPPDGYIPTVPIIPVKRLSKEDWLKQNYPGMTELPKWRFPGLAG
jgi:hypothetical protein